jgi:Na+/proline symporter
MECSIRMIKSRSLRIALISVPVALAFAAILGRAMFQIMKGNGAGTYKNVYGMEIHWVTVITVAASLLIAFFIGLVVRWWQRRADRKLDSLLASTRKDTK